MELCVGPSFATLSKEYSKFGIVCYGNDVDRRWVPKDPELKERFVHADAFCIRYDVYDAVVFAPPLSRGCTGKREDALRVDEVDPPYSEFIERLAWMKTPPKLAVLVLPGRSLSTKRDREATYKVVNLASQLGIVELQERRDEGIMKYLDIIVRLT